MDLMKWVRKRPRTPDSEESGGSDQQSTNNSADVANVNIANNSPKSVPVKKRKTGIDSDWVKEFPWLLVVDDERGMLCSLCRMHNRLKKGGTKVWIEVPCTTIEKFSIKRHAESQQHQGAVKVEAVAREAKSRGDISHCVQKAVNLERKAFLAALQSMYWLLKHEIPHSTNFPSLINLMSRLGVSYLRNMQKGQNANYTSEMTMREMVKVLADVPRNAIIDSMRSSEYYSVMIDETTDISVIKQLIIFGRYVDGNNEVKSSLLGVRELPDCSADTICTALQEFLTSLDLDFNRMVGFGSDGAPVMIGRKNGVAAKLKSSNKKIINIHCIAHRLALAAAQAVGGIQKLIKFKDMLGQLYRYYGNSSVRSAHLKEIQSVTNSKDDCVKLREAKDVRWLSHHVAVTALRRTYTAVLKSLDYEATERNDASARGLHLYFKSFDACASLLMMSDILPFLAKLSKLFQRQQINYSDIDVNVTATIDALDRLKTSPGTFLTDLPSFVNSADIPYDAQKFQFFLEKVHRPFLENIIENLKNRFPDNKLLSAFTLFDPNEVDMDHTDHLELLIGHFGTEVLREDVLSEHRTLVELLRGPYSTLSTSEVLSRMRTNQHDTMPSMSKLASAIAVIPVSTTDCERGFSTLKRIKTGMRNRLKQETLEHLLMVAIEGDEEEDFEFNKACDNWAMMRNRRLNTSL